MYRENIHACTKQFHTFCTCMYVFSVHEFSIGVEEKTRLDGLGLPETELKSRVNGSAQDWLDAKYPLAERENVEKLDLSELGLQGELNLEGFTNLKSLDCSDNELVRKSCVTSSFLCMLNSKIKVSKPSSAG